ncbi:alpha/beta fold hydrolase [Streptomyces capparidis]
MSTATAGTAFVNGITLAYEDHGTGEPVLLIHGHPFDRSMWAPQTAHLAATGWRAIVPDLRGYGGSQVVPGVAGLDVLAGDLAALLDHLGVERAVVAGLSMGGQIAMDFHRQFPERVRALVLADTFAQAETDEGRRTRNAMADRLLREGMGGYADEVLTRMLAPYNVEALPDVAGHVLRMMRGAPPEGAAAALRGRAERPDYTDMLPRVAVPALVVVGRDDAFTPVADAEYLRDRIPGASLTVVEGAGHMPNLERPEVFNRALGDFLASLAPARP